jgi:ketosteroid isomerase-like protein
MKIFIGAAFLLLLVSPPDTLASGQECMNHGDPVAVENVRMQRHSFNQAIAGKDLQTIKSILDEDVLLVTGTDSDIYSGADAQLEIWSTDFASADRAVYVRTPLCIRVSPVAPVALEYGAWRGERVTGAENFATGSYAAKWRRVDGRWRLEGEIFATESCGGDFCPASVAEG